jgi:dTDP-4-dehydrorhamnose 3,5-epimerase
MIEDVTDRMSPEERQKALEVARETIHETEFPGLYVIDRKYFPDDRGAFQEIWRPRELSLVIGRPVEVKQENLSFNFENVVRGLHAEPQDKLVTPMSGSIEVVVADIRLDSPTFGRVFRKIFDYTSDPLEPHSSVFVPEGMANGFRVIKGPAIYKYSVTSEYNPDPSVQKRQIRYDDPDLNIDWEIAEPIMSEQDKSKNPSLRDLFSEKFNG